VKPPETILEAADIGSGAKGHYNNEGLYTTPVSVFFRVQDRIAFQIQVPHALQLFKAINNRAPKDHEEFMQKIIRENQIRLPDLPEGHSYVYDPETEQLMVRRPAPRPIPGISESK
jgi:hypothetical protein